jgi:hypothetical protein
MANLIKIADSPPALHPNQIKVLGLPVGFRLQIAAALVRRIADVSHWDIGYATITPDGFSFTNEPGGQIYQDGYAHLLSRVASGQEIAFRIGESQSLYWWGAKLWIPTAGNKLTIASPTSGRWGDF